jgi:dihydropteroate synthase
VRILKNLRADQLKKLFREIKVDSYGSRIMLPKAIQLLVWLPCVPGIWANILKQEMLSLGADAAVSRGTLTGRDKKTACLLMANLDQLNQLQAKLAHQPFGLSILAKELKSHLAGYQKDSFTLHLNGYKIKLGSRTRIMGILNITPDSFSGDGLSAWPAKKIAEYAENLVKDGADILDIGGESSRPGAKALACKEELKRVLPVLRMLRKRLNIPLSVDTYKPEVAKAALDNGASLINDISGLRNPRMVRVISRSRAGVVIMHMQGRPQNMQKNPHYSALLPEIMAYLYRAMEDAQKAGIAKERIILDPGIGFGKTLLHNLEILKGLSELKALGQPLLVGVSRKSFIGKILHQGPQQRLNGTLAGCVLAVKNGARILRVHDVRAVKEALRVYEAIENA